MTISALKPPTKSTKPALKPPRYLKKAGRELWLSVASAFVLEQHDVTLLTALCETLDRKNQAENKLRKAKAQLSRTAMGIDTPCGDCDHQGRKYFNGAVAKELNLSEEPRDSRPPPLRFGGEK